MAWSIIGDAGNQPLRRQFDFLITTHAADAKPAEKPFQIIEKYVDAVGHARKQPYPGYWHSKNRYASQEELLDVARGFHNRSIPVDVIVIGRSTPLSAQHRCGRESGLPALRRSAVPLLLPQPPVSPSAHAAMISSHKPWPRHRRVADWYHWKIMGDWSFNPDAWPDPKAMVDECRSYGMEIMVSVWPFTCPGSRSYDTLVKNNWVTTFVGADGKRTNLPIETHGKNCHHVDATNPDFRKYAWSLIETGYYNYGIKIFWLDASEPEGFGPLATNASWIAGDMRDVSQASGRRPKIAVRVRDSEPSSHASRCRWAACSLSTGRKPFTTVFARTVKRTLSCCLVRGGSALGATERSCGLATLGQRWRSSGRRWTLASPRKRQAFRGGRRTLAGTAVARRRIQRTARPLFAGSSMA